MTKLCYVVSAVTLFSGGAVLAQSPAAAAGAAALQTATGQPNTSGKHAQSSNGEIAVARQTVPCQHIITECKKLGYLVGQYKKDNGLWMDCFNPVVHGKQPTRDGATVTVPVNPSDVQACRAALPKKATGAS